MTGHPLALLLARVRPTLRARLGVSVGAVCAAVLLPGELLTPVLVFAALLVPAQVGRAMQALQRGGGLAELLSTGTSALEVMDDLAAEGARRGRDTALWLILPVLGTLWLLHSLSDRLALYLAALATLLCPLVGVHTAMGTVAGLPGVSPTRKKPSRLRQVVSFVPAVAVAAVWLGYPEALFVLLPLPAAALLQRRELARRLEAWSNAGAVVPPALSFRWESALRIRPTRADVLRALVTGGRAMLARPALATFPAVAGLAAGGAAWGIAAALSTDRGVGLEGALLVPALVAAGLAALGVLQVFGEVRGETEGATLSALWTSRLSAAGAVDGWASVWVVPAVLGGLVAFPAMAALAVQAGVPLPAALLAAGLPPLAAPLAGYAGVWAGCAGRSALGATACAAGLPLVAAYGLYRWLDGSGLYLPALALGVLVLAPVVARALAIREARQSPTRAGFTGG